ncbi:unnamed protein product [Paramecium primaurelia]|uniref:Uncharacterized protein n=1 Tax=Paramecium primaurelia TaxID=5886 RepID=A0A8S1NSN0_PARPR|nr:unnamed protein product [Paramecium primaurelia]
MGQSGSKKEIEGNILIILERKNYFCGEFIKGSVSYSVQDSEIKAFLQLICVAERYVKKKRLYQEKLIEQTLMLSQPNEKGVLEKPFSIMTPQLQSMELNTWNKDEQIYIKYFLRSYLNFENHKLKDKQKKISEEQIFIKRTYQNKIENIIKQFSYVTRSWFLGDDQRIEFWYDFENKNFRSNERFSFWLGVDNRHTTINIESIKAYLVFEILEFQVYWKLIERRVLSCLDERIKVPFGIQNTFQINLIIPSNSPTAILSKKIMMFYHVEIEFEFEYMGCRRQSYIEKILIDVVNCENQ